MNVMEAALAERIDPYLTPSSLSALASRALGHTVEVRDAEVLTGGCWNRVIAVRPKAEEPDLVFKISAERVAPGLEREFAVLRYFSDHTRMPVPRPLLLDTSCSLVPGALLVMQRLPGTVMHAVFHRLDAGDRRRIMDEIADYVVDLHRARAQGFGGVELAAEDRHGRWPEFWMPRFRAVVDEAKSLGTVSTRLLGEIEEAAGGFEEVLDVGPASTLTHYDIWSGNVMIDFAGGEPRVSGFLDVPGHWADYARELSFMDMFGLADQRLYRRYAARHPLDRGFELRKSIYNLKMHLKHISMYPDESYYRRGVASCLETIRGSM